MMDKRYFIPDDIEEALSLKSEEGSSASFLGGGTFLGWTPAKDESSIYIDLRKVLGRNITQEKNTLVIGALISLQEIVDAPQLPEALRREAGGIKSRQVRNLATLGGNIGANRPDSNLIPVLLALGARMRLGGGSEIPLLRWIAEPSEILITDVVIPLPPRRVAAARVTRRANAYPVITCAVTLTPKPMVVVGGALEAITRLKVLEEALETKKNLPPLEIEGLVRGELKAESDIHGSADYKRYIAAITIADTLVRCRTEEG